MLEGRRHFPLQHPRDPRYENIKASSTSTDSISFRYCLLISLSTKSTEFNIIPGLKSSVPDTIDFVDTVANLSAL